jgi:hypothetical protein
LANKAKYPGYDYTYLTLSQKELEQYNPMCQNPWDNTRFFNKESR